MKYLTNFKTKEEYNSFKDSSNYIYPNISYIEDSGSVINKSPQIQEKQVEITENGEITITPDAGFSYLNSVKVNTNVPTSGGSDGSASSWRYFSMAGLSASDKASVAAVVMVAKGVNPQDNSITILTPAAASMLGVGYDVFGFDANVRIIMSGIEMTLGESFDAHPLKDKITEITESEFYDLNA